MCALGHVRGQGMLALERHRGIEGKVGRVPCEQVPPACAASSVPMPCPGPGHACMQGGRIGSRNAGLGRPCHPSLSRWGHVMVKPGHARGPRLAGIGLLGRTATQGVQGAWRVLHAPQTSGLPMLMQSQGPHPAHTCAYLPMPYASGSDWVCGLWHHGLCSRTHQSTVAFDWSQRSLR